MYVSDFRTRPERNSATLGTSGVRLDGSSWVDTSHERSSIEKRKNIAIHGRNVCDGNIPRLRVNRDETNRSFSCCGIFCGVLWSSFVLASELYGCLLLPGANFHQTEIGSIHACSHSIPGVVRKSSARVHSRQRRVVHYKTSDVGPIG
jgi:hypothetical protein